MENERLDALTGQLLATQAAVRALILLSPNPTAANTAMLEQIERVLAAALPKAGISEALLGGVIDAKKRLQPSASDLARLQARK